MGTPKAILIVSYGSSYENSGGAGIGCLEKRISAEFPEYTVRRAFSVHTVKRLQQREGIAVDTTEQALQCLAEEGFTEVFVHITEIVPGYEYDSVAEVVKQFKAAGKFKTLVVGYPLLYYLGQEGTTDQLKLVLQAFKTQLPAISVSEAILVMAHGTLHPAHAYYYALQAKINGLGWMNTFVYTLKGAPGIQDIVLELEKRKITSVHLVPFMFSAGSHVLHDMAGETENSHKNLLIAAGYQVITHTKGLGENEAVQELYLNNLRDMISHCK